MFLLADPTTNEIKLELWEENKQISQVDFTDNRKLADKLLPHLEDFLKKTGFSLKNLKGIVVVSGPGSFTGLRIALSTFNALAYSLNIPILGVKKSEFNQRIFGELGRKEYFKEPVMPFYGEKPKTTKPKS